MNIYETLTTYIHYLIHPFQTHDAFIHPERYGEENIPLKLGVYESLATSWLFVIINGVFRIILLNFTILFLMDLFNDDIFDYSILIDLKDFSGLNFIVLSSILDIIFYPLFGIFIIQFWEVLIRFYGKALGVQGDLTEKAQSIISVYFSSSILRVIPIMGSVAQSIAAMILMYAGLRKQLKSSPVLSVCIILTPFLMLLAMVSFIFVIVLVAVS